MPDDTKHFGIAKNKIRDKLFLAHSPSDIIMTDDIELNGVDWQLIGLTSEFTEDISQDLLPRKSPYSGLIMFKYFDYVSKIFSLDNALDSFKSLMQHLQVYEVNPYGEYPMIINHRRLPVSMVQRKKERWHKANQNVGKWIVLFKPN